MKPPKFSKAQLAYLHSILRVGCCHVSGMHDPTHFLERPDAVCDIQRRNAYDHAIVALGFKLEPGIADEDCGWCSGKYTPEYKKKHDWVPFSPNQYVHDVRCAHCGNRRSANGVLPVTGCRGKQ